ncbi:hypothetical protein CI105_00545 [Candidatus Izimaplasma bacterium ZiA1]|uniref:Bax inhibitor-1/YccA family membrane protein n=1 Tax=Candidatus Izimoplasma sp. ZiA1 TaxID=2024899 RepID=UPI000BAA38EE|nr:hypothetical protein CI105_00545 [Candidatus Izimaplasma bacterium ZiA1]
MLKEGNIIYKYFDYSRNQDGRQYATYLGVFAKTTILFSLLFAISYYYYTNTVVEGNEAILFGAIIGAPLIAFFSIKYSIEFPKATILLSISFVAAEGVFIGYLCAFLEYVFNSSIVYTAFLATLSVIGGTLFLYITGLLRINEYYKKVLFTVIVGGIIFYLVTNFFPTFTFSNYEDFEIIIAGIVVISSSLILVYDYQRVTNYVQAEAPKNTEWSLGLGLLVNVIWVFVYMLYFLLLLTTFGKKIR